MFYEFFIFVGIKRLILKINSATAVLVDKNNATGEGLGFSIGKSENSGFF